MKQVDVFIRPQITGREHWVGSVYLRKGENTAYLSSAILPRGEVVDIRVEITKHKKRK